VNIIFFGDESPECEMWFKIKINRNTEETKSAGMAQTSTKTVLPPDE